MVFMKIFIAIALLFFAFIPGSFAQSSSLEFDLASLENALKANPEDPRLNNSLGLAFIKTKHYQKSIPHLKKSDPH